MTHQMDRWDKEHRTFSRLLDVFELQLTLLRGDGEPDYNLMLDIMEYLTSYSDRVHHPREDIIFAKVAEREPAVKQTVEELSKQHHEMAENGKALHARLQSILSGMIESRQAIESAGRGYVATFRRHMDKEYQDLFPTARQALNQEDWDRVEAEAGPIDADPLSGERLDQQYAALRKAIASAMKS